MKRSRLLTVASALLVIVAWMAWVRLIRPLQTGYYSFQDVTDAAGIHFVTPGVHHPIHLEDTGGPGLAWGDYDGDGYPDLLMCQGGAQGRTVLYRNRGDGTFEDVTAESGLAKALQGCGPGALFIDTRNRGEMDLVFTSAFPHPGTTWLAENQGDGTFRVRPLGHTKKNILPTSLAAADYDDDGFVDVFQDDYITIDPTRVARTYRMAPVMLNPDAYRGARKYLWHNLGHGRFEDATFRAGVADRDGRSLGVVFCDLENDNRPDIFITNDLNADALYSNQGNGTFLNVALPANVASCQSGMGIAVGDYDCAGAMDLFVTHFSNQSNALFHNDIEHTGRLVFTDVADAAGVGFPEQRRVCWGTQFLDVSGDGLLDLIVVSGHILPDRHMQLIPFHPQLFMQTSPGHFEEVGHDRGPFALKLCARGLGVADYDRDGRPDVAFVGINARGRL